MAFLFTGIVFITNTTVCLMCVLQGDIGTAALTLMGALISGCGVCNGIQNLEKLEA